LIFKEITDDKTKTEKLCSVHIFPHLKDVTLFSPILLLVVKDDVTAIYLNKFFSSDKEKLLILTLSSDRKFSIYNSSAWENNVNQDENIAPWPKRDRVL